jgi:hypothetical protein
MKLWSKRSDAELEARAHRANALLTDELLSESLDAIEAACIERWKLAATPAEREAEWLAYSAAVNVRRTLGLVVQRGKEAATKRTLAEQAAERVRKMRGAA